MSYVAGKGRRFEFWIDKIHLSNWQEEQRNLLLSTLIYMNDSSIWRKKVLYIFLKKDVFNAFSNLLKYFISLVLMSTLLKSIGNCLYIFFTNLFCFNLTSQTLNYKYKKKVQSAPEGCKLLVWIIDVVSLWLEHFCNCYFPWLYLYIKYLPWL